ncbi:MAG: rhodanese-like domain-containing protein [Chitinophagaceae bacterium]|nr:rhodanese-like domain-containing protein [Chitinophagaceae bacterium]
MKYLIFILFLLFANFQSANAQFVTVTPEEAAVKMKKKRTVVLDVRTKEEFAEGHLPKAVNIDVLDSANFVQQIQTLNKRKQYVVYCRSGKRSMKASELLAGSQFKHIYNMEGGILAWKGVLQNKKQ